MFLSIISVTKLMYLGFKAMVTLLKLKTTTLYANVTRKKPQEKLVAV